MKFASVAAVSVLFCVVTVYAAPTFDANKEIKELRERLKCIFDVFDVIIREYKELEMYYDLPKTYLGVANTMLDRCEEMEDDDLKGEYPLKQRCFDDTQDMIADVYIKDFLHKLEKKNDKLTANYIDETFIKYATPICPNLPWTGKED